MQVLSWNMNKAAFWKPSLSIFSTCGQSMFPLFYIYWSCRSVDRKKHTHTQPEEINGEEISNYSEFQMKAKNIDYDDGKVFLGIG